MARKVLPAPTPLYTLRPSNSATVNHISFSLPGRILTVDADGWITVWILGRWRIESIWKAHESENERKGKEKADIEEDGDKNGGPQDDKQEAGREGPGVGGVLWAERIGADVSGRDLILSQGRDHRLALSALPSQPSSTLSRAPTAPSISNPSKNVELLAESPTNALGFCKAHAITLGGKSFVATPSAVNEDFVDVYRVDPPTNEGRKAGIRRTHRAVGEGAHSQKTGTVMAVNLFEDPSSSARQPIVSLLVGYEDGRLSIFCHRGDLTELCSSERPPLSTQANWQLIWTSVVHREPIMSVVVGRGALNKSTEPGYAEPWCVGWSAGADHRIGRVDIGVPSSIPSPRVAAQASEVAEEIGSRTSPVLLDTSIKGRVYRTLCPGRASVAVRSDGRILATAGWDGLIRIYDARLPQPCQISVNDSLRELPELGELEVRSGRDENDKDRGSGVGALAFAPLDCRKTSKLRGDDETSGDEDEDEMEGRAFLAAAGKGGRVVVWEVYPPRSWSAV